MASRPKEVIINADNFSNLEEFFVAIDKVLTKDLEWNTGHDLDAFNDLLRGGFGVHEYEEPIHITWLNISKSKSDLGWDETVKYLSEKLKTCHPSNIEYVKEDLVLAKKQLGQTLFELIVKIIRSHEHIALTLL